MIGEEFKAMVAREFRRVAYTGTMGWRQQLVRPAHEVALGIWLARLAPNSPLTPSTRSTDSIPPILQSPNPPIPQS